MNIKHKYFIYARKSTDDTSRQIRSIDDQIAELRELASRSGITPVKTFIEKQTAKKPGRPVFNEMLDRIERGEADGILAWHPDRLARNSLDGGRIIYLLDEGKLTSLKFSTFWFDPTPQGKLMLSIAFGMSKYYVDNLAENIKRGQRQKVQNGIFPQWAPLGYLNDRVTRTITVDPHSGPLIRTAFELYATGTYTLKLLRDKVNALGLLGKKGRELSVSNYQYILRNPVYYGLIRFSGELYEGKHEPLITKQLFDRCQEVMQRKSKPKHPGYKPFLYRGMFRCGECGCFVTTEAKTKRHKCGSVHHYTYCRCTKRVKPCSQPCVREEHISEQITEALAAVTVPAEWTTWMLATLEGKQQQDTKLTVNDITTFQQQIRDIDQKIDRLMTAYTSDVLTLDEFRNAKSILVTQRQEFKEKQKAAEANRVSRFEPVIGFVRSLQEASLQKATRTVTENRDFFRKVGSNLFLKDGIISWVPQGPWKTLIDYGPFARPNSAHVPCAPNLAGETDHNYKKRRERDLNPRYRFKPVHRFSKPAP